MESPDPVTVIIQFLLSISSAVIVAWYTVKANKSRYFDQQWWDRKAIKYEEIIQTLAELERAYGKWQLDTSDRSHPTAEAPEVLSGLIDTIETAEATSIYFLDEKSSELLRALVARFHQDELESGSGEDHRLIFNTCQFIQKTKQGLVKNAKKELKNR